RRPGWQRGAPCTGFPFNEDLASTSAVEALKLPHSHGGNKIKRGRFRLAPSGSTTNFFRVIRRRDRRSRNCESTSARHSRRPHFRLPLHRTISSAPVERSARSRRLHAAGSDTSCKV